MRWRRAGRPGSFDLAFGHAARLLIAVRAEILAVALGRAVSVAPAGADPQMSMSSQMTVLGSMSPFANLVIARKRVELTGRSVPQNIRLVD